MPVGADKIIAVLNVALIVAFGIVPGKILKNPEKKITKLLRPRYLFYIDFAYSDGDIPTLSLKSFEK